MADEKPGITRQILNHALITATGVIVTFYITKSLNKSNVAEAKSEGAKGQEEALAKTTALLNTYIMRYDSLHSKYLAVMDRRSGASDTYGEESYTSGNSNQSNYQQSSSRAFSVEGNWLTADGTVMWTFTGNRVGVSGYGTYMGILEGNGRYNAGGNGVNGTVNVSKSYYMPVNYIVNFSLTPSGQEGVMYGTITDASGVQTPAMLYKQ